MDLARACYLLGISLIALGIPQAKAQISLRSPLVIGQCALANNGGTVVKICRAPDGTYRIQAPDQNGVPISNSQLDSGSASLDQKCQGEAQINAWTSDCMAWKIHRDAEQRASQEAAEKERADELARQRAEQENLARQREEAAVAKDEREGYHHITFEQFSLDGPSMPEGSKVAIQGIYVNEGHRLYRDQLSAIRTIQTGDSIEGTEIPLATESATRASRALFLHCAESPVGCVVVVRGRLETLTMQNKLGGSWTELGIAVDDAR